MSGGKQATVGMKSIESKQRWILIALAAISAGTIITEVALTKFIGYKLFFHFTYAIISLVMFSFGLAGSMIFLRPGKYDSDSPGYWWQAAKHSSSFSWALMAAVAIFCVLPLDNYRNLLPQPWHTLNYFICTLIFAIPFYQGGLAITQVLAGSRIKLTVVYAVDLLAAALGAFMTPFLLENLGGYGTMFIAALLGAVAAAGFACASDLKIGSVKTQAWTQTALVVVMSIALFGVPELCKSYAGFDILSLKDPGMGNFFNRFGGLAKTYWNAIARIDVSKTSASKYSGLAYGVNSAVKENLFGRYILVDGCANTRQLKFDSETQRAKVLGTNVFAAPYVTFGPLKNMMIIGAGGGIDITIAKFFQVPNIDVVELNPSTYKLLTGRAGDPEADWYVPSVSSDATSKVNLSNVEARHFLSRVQPATYDIIHAGAVDTLAAIASGGMSLCENYLYTKDAVKIYYKALKPGGILSLTHWRRQPPHIGLRMFTTYLDALEDLGIKEPWRQTMSIGGDWTVNLLKTTPFTEPEVTRLKAWAKSNGYTVLFDPLHPDMVPPDPKEAIFQKLAMATPEQRLQLMEDYIYNVKPCTDDNPYFYKTSKGTSDWGFIHTEDSTHYWLISFASVGALLLAFLPLLRVRTPEARLLLLNFGPGFAISGFAFLMFETTLIQALTIFVGGPLYSLATTLVAVLGGYALGSFACRRFQPTAKFFTILGGVLCVIFVSAFFLINPLVSHLMFLPNEMRILVSVVITLLMAVPTGMLVPMAAELVSLRNANAVPWMWGINAGFNVLGGVSYVPLSMIIGIRATLFVVAGLYLIAALLMALAANRESASSSSAKNESVN